MSQKNHKTENLGNWKPFVEQLHKEWEEVGNEHVIENYELKEKIWKEVDRKIFSPRRYILRTGWAVAAVLVGVMFYLGYKVSEKHVVDNLTYMEYSYVEGRMCVLPDSSTVWLEPDSKIRISSEFLNNREVWLTGSSVFEVKKRADSAFKVYINTACIEVKGTVFSINQPTPDTSIIALYEGAIDFIGKNQSLISMTPSQRLVYDVHTGSTHVENFSENIQWVDGNYRFTDIRIDSLMDFIRKKYRVEVELDKAINYDLLLTGTIRNDETVDAVIEKICFTSCLNYKKEGLRYILTK
ncbi:FecR family protein [Phocaeicola plebeius]|uniref:FecR family protein n=1 Tax=Phocaeicola plebeius TaxID=310297 RepID=UPI00307788D9